MIVQRLGGVGVIGTSAMSYVVAANHVRKHKLRVMLLARVFSHAKEQRYAAMRNVREIPVVVVNLTLE